MTSKLPAAIKVGASDHATLYTIVTPVGPYFSTTTNGVSLLAVGEHVRSWPGGTGGFKLGLNYSPGFAPQQAAAALGYDQVLWLLGPEKQITEAGAMNFFAVVEREDGGAFFFHSSFFLAFPLFPSPFFVLHSPPFPSSYPPFPSPHPPLHTLPNPQT
jgi:branched-subunit amino acid aminotransferase/4-amino-4-deoxychorismate lyase